MPTKISDVIIPEIFAGYVNKDPLQLNNFINSGVMVRTPEFDNLVSNGGYTATLPFWAELEGDYEERTDGDDPNVNFNKITAKKEIGVKLFDIYRVGASQLSSELAGSDAIKAIREKLSHKISSLDEARLISTLKGVFASTDMKSNILDITKRTGNEALLSAKSIIEGQGLLGDRQSSMVAIAMHSMTYTWLKMNNLISTIPSSEQGQEIALYANKRVIIDDSLKPTGDVYTTYLFANGAVNYGRGGELYPVEVGKIAFSEEEGVVIRKNHMFHVRGTTWAGAMDTMAKITEIEKGTNWKKAYANKQIPIVAIKHKVDLSSPVVFGIPNTMSSIMTNKK